MQLLDLPLEIVYLLPHHLCSLQDLYHLSKTCRVFYHTCMSSNAALPPIFPKLYGQPLLPPHPHLLLAGTARQIADWAVQSVDNRSELYEVLLRGNEGLVELAGKVTRLTLKEVKALYATKGDLLYPLTRIIETEAGRDTCPDELRISVCEEPELALLNYWIYCELFHHDIEYSYLGLSMSLRMEPLNSEIRGRWMAYCMPDINNGSNPDHNQVKSCHLFEQIKMWQSKSMRKRDEQLAYFFETGKITLDNPRFQKDWLGWSHADTSQCNQALFIRVAVSLGKESLEMLLPGNMLKFEKRLENIKQLVKLVETRNIYKDDYDEELDEEGFPLRERYDETIWWGGFMEDVDLNVGRRCPNVDCPCHDLD